MSDGKLAEKDAIRIVAKQKDEDENNHYNDLPPPPDGGYGWVIVAVSFLCNMIVDGIGYTFGIFFPEIVNDYGETKGKTAWVGSLLTGMYMCAGPLVSVLANKFGCRTACIVGSLTASVAFAVSIFSPNVNVLMLTYGFIGGIGFGLIYLPAVVCVGYYFETKRSLATGIAVCGSGVGTFVFAPLATILLELYGWRGANLILAGIILNCVAFGALMRPLEYPTKNQPELQEFKRNSAVTLDNLKPTQELTKASSHGALAVPVIGKRKRNDSTGSYWSRNLTDAENSRHASKLSLSSRKGHFIQPLARKDVFYSGSIAHLKEYRSQKSLSSYRHSILDVSHVKDGRDKQKPENNYISLLKDPVFLLFAISSAFAMAAFYVPFVYLVDCAKADGIDVASASFLLSIIGITNTVARIVCGYIADFPQVNALFVNNICLVIAVVSVGVTPFCHTYLAYAIMSVFYAIAVAGYISLSSIILVDLLGLDKLTDAFGLLILFRGAAALVGSPVAGALYDATQSYDIPFFVAATLFGISAVLSFMVPCVKVCLPQDKRPQYDEEVLTPINQKEKV